MTGADDPAMHSINQRPRRLGGPLAAIAAVVILVVILVAAGLHSNTPSHRGGNSTSTTVTHSHSGTHAGSGAPHTTHTTTTTAPPAPSVSAPANTSPYTATYQVADASYSLELGAKTGECWVLATDTSTGKVLFTGTLSSGQTQTIAAAGPVTVVAGAPVAFSAAVNGAPVTLPTGALAPFTLTFKTPGGTGGAPTGSSGTAGTAGNTGTTPG
jgi:hypothetical protein